jgi:hypothetical protein
MGGRVTTYCAYERASFPDDEFRDDATHGRVHIAGSEHTVTGFLLGATGPDPVIEVWRKKQDTGDAQQEG